MAANEVIARLQDLVDNIPYPYIVIPLTALLAFIVQRCTLSPLAHLPGPLITNLTSLWLYRLTYIGREASVIDAIHKIYESPVIRIAPNEVSVADGRALQQVYITHGGFKKAPYYRNFDIDGHATIFSELDVEERAKRSKAIVGMFAMGSLRKDGEATVRDVVEKWCYRFEKELNDHGIVDLLGLSRRLALDAVTGYLFDRSYGGLDEPSAEEKGKGAGEAHGRLSAALFVDTFVAVGRFFYLPTWIFAWVEMIAEYTDKEKVHIEGSMSAVDKFVEDVVESSNPKRNENTYQARLLNAGISMHETKAQCKDLMFAGTDSTGMNLATIVWNLAREPSLFKQLRDEVLALPADTDPQTFPFLSAVVKEGLRVSMANPTRMPRVVPYGGCTLPSGHYLPAGTCVGTAPYSLHFQEDVFESPMAFRPERWLSATSEMQRDYIPFGIGSRQCIARNLATVELHIAVQALARRDSLKGVKPAQQRIDIVEWFNSKVVGERIELISGS